MLSKEKRNIHQRKYTEQIKTEVINHYGGKCFYCNHIKIKSLTIDHIKGKGTKHRKEMKFSGLQFYKWLKNNNYPDDFQCLCMNCQFIKREESNEYGN